MPTTCPSCHTKIIENSTRCQACGRSLVQAAPQSMSVSDDSPSPHSSANRGDVNEYVIHAVISLLCGIVGLVAMLLLLRRNFMDKSTLSWVIFIGVGFILPAAAGFWHSYRQEVIAKRRKKEGIRAMRK